MGTRCKASAFPQRLGSLRLPHFPQTRRRNYLQTINQGVGPFYSIGVGSFYVIEATRNVFPEYLGPFAKNWRTSKHILSCRFTNRFKQQRRELEHLLLKTSSKQ